MKNKTLHKISWIILLKMIFRDVFVIHFRKKTQKKKNILQDCFKDFSFVENVCATTKSWNELFSIKIIKHDAQDGHDTDEDEDDPVRADNAASDSKKWALLLLPPSTFFWSAHKQIFFPSLPSAPHQGLISPTFYDRILHCSELILVTYKKSIKHFMCVFYSSVHL